MDTTPMFYVSYTDDNGREIAIEGADIEDCAAQIPEGNTTSRTVYDEAGFVRGWVTSPKEWRNA